MKHQSAPQPALSHHAPPEQDYPDWLAGFPPLLQRQLAPVVRRLDWINQKQPSIPGYSYDRAEIEATTKLIALARRGLQRGE